MILITSDDEQFMGLISAHSDYASNSILAFTLFNSCVGIWILKSKRVFLCDLRPLNVAECKNDPQRVPMKFEGGSFEPIKIFPKIFFTGSFSGSGPEIHRFVRTLEEV